MDKEKERLQKKYNDYVKQVTPTHNLWWNMAKASFDCSKLGMGIYYIS